jgi:Protein of unknown function (DUF2628)
MQIYTVHESSRPSELLEQRASDVVFIKEGFTWWGFLFGPLWLLYHGLWFEFIGALLILAGASSVLMEAGMSSGDAATLANLLLALIVGFEGNNLRRWRLARKGYVFLTSVAGKSFEECERRFFDSWLPTVAKPPVNATAKPASLGQGPNSWGDWPGPGTVGTLPGETV